MYTCMYEASDSGQSCFDPLLFHYPENDDVFNSSTTENSFIVADALLVHPVLEPGVETYPAYFPNDRNGTWVSMNDMSDMHTPSPTSMGEWKNLTASNESINVYLRPGSIIPF